MPLDLSHLANDPYRISSKNPPKLRGKIHLAATLPAMGLAGWLISASPSGGYRAITAIYACSIVFMLLASSLYHNWQWSDRKWWRLRQLDHTGIYVLIAGTYLAYGSMALRGELRIVSLALVGGIITLNLTYRWLPVVPFRGVTNLLFLATAWLSAIFSYWLLQILGVVGFSLLIGGGVVFTLGALVLGKRKPNPSPAFFGYHEIWHVATIIGIGLQAAGLVVGVF